MIMYLDNYGDFLCPQDKPSQRPCDGPICPWFRYRGRSDTRKETFSCSANVLAQPGEVADLAVEDMP